MGRKPNQLISTHFKRGQKLDNSSNRYEQTCIHCDRSFPKGRPEVLTSHLSKCPALSPATRINILNQPDNAQQSSRSEIDQNYNQQHNVGLQQLADVAEAAGAATMRVALANDHSIPLDPQLSAPNHNQHHANGNPLIVPQFPYQNYYTPAASYGAAEDDIRAASAASVYPSLGGPALTGETSQYSPSPNISAATFPNAFGQYSSSEQMPNILVNSMPGVEFDEFGPTSTDAIPNILSQVNSLGPIDPSVTQQSSDDAGEVSSTPTRSASKPRKAKEPYSADKRKKIADVRRVKPCIRCSRLQKSCSINKPCSECLKVQTSKNWRGPCTKFRNSNEFDVWYQQPVADQLNALIRQVTNEYTLEGTGRYVVDIRLHSISSPPISFEVSRASGPEAGDVIWIPDETFDLKFALTEYLRINITTILQAINEPQLQLTLERAYSLTHGRRVALARVIRGQQMEGDDNLRGLIDLWLAVYLLSSRPWTMTILDPNGTPHVTESDQSMVYINLKLDACLESVIADSRSGPIPPKDGSEEPDYTGSIHEFDVTRVSSSSHREFYNLLLGIIIILSAVERYCALTRMRTGALPAEYREKAEEYARKYVYAVRGVSILPVLEPEEEDPAGGSGRFVAVKQETVVGSANASNRTIVYTLIKAYVAGLRLQMGDLQAMSSSVDAAWNGSITAWDGWLWGRLFLAMVEP